MQNALASSLKGKGWAIPFKHMGTLEVRTNDFLKDWNFLFKLLAILLLMHVYKKTYLDWDNSRFLANGLMIWNMWWYSCLENKTFK